LNALWVPVLGLLIVGAAILGVLQAPGAPTAAQNRLAASACRAAPVPPKITPAVAEVIAVKGTWLTALQGSGRPQLAALATTVRGIDGSTPHEAMQMIEALREIAAACQELHLRTR
jgi:hypothetical protein